MLLRQESTMFGWFRRRRRRKLAAEPFPQEWARILKRNVRYWYWLSRDERERWKNLIRYFVAEREFEGCGGQEITDEVKVTIAGQACLLALGLDDDNPFRNVTSILVYPNQYIVPGDGAMSPLQRITGPISMESSTMLGQAHINAGAGRGPVILSWSHTVQGGRNPADGSNLVIHEFAHKLDMLDAVADGLAILEAHRTPIDGPDSEIPPGRLLADEYEDLQRELSWGAVANRDPSRRPLLRAYAGTNPAEFFAVSSEVFFERPLDMREDRPRLYGALQRIYNQDPAKREWAIRSGRGVKSGD